MNSFLLTIQLVIVSVVFAATVGILGAWAAWTVERFGQSRNGLIGWLARMIASVVFTALVVAAALPMILHAAAWEATAGKFGWLVLTQTGARGPGDAGYTGLGGVFGGLVASGWIHGMFSSVVVALATWHAVKHTPRSAIQQSELEMGPVRSWWRVRLPIAFPWVAAALLATAAIATTEMTVVDLYGYRTVTDLVYLQFAILVNGGFGAIAKTSLPPLAFATVILFVAATMLRKQTATQAEPFSENTGNQNRVSDAEAPAKWLFLLCSSISLLFAAVVVVVPVVGLLVKLGHQVVIEDSVRRVSWSGQQCLDNLLSAPALFHAEYQWTAILSVSTAFCAVITGWITASVARQSVKAQRVFDLVSIGMVLLPGPILALSIVRLFQADVPGFRQLYHQTLVPTILALWFRAGPVAYWIIRSGYQGIGRSVLETARVEMPILRRIWVVDRPLLFRSLLGATVASAIVSSGDVPAMLPVIPPGVTTVGTRLFEQLHSGARYQEASLAIWYVGAIATIALIWVRVSRWTHGRME